MKKSQVKVNSKVLCKRNCRDDDRFKHEFIGIVLKKLEHSAVVLINVTLKEDDQAMYEAHGKTVIPYKEMKNVRKIGADYYLK